jgi:hypothetical protein
MKQILRQWVSELFSIVYNVSGKRRSRQSRWR